MALFENIKRGAKTMVEDLLNQPRSDAPVTEGHATAERETEWDSPAYVPVLPWRSKKDVDIAPPPLGDDLQKPQDTNPNAYAASSVDPSIPVMSLVDAQSKAMMDEAQDAINVDNSGAEEVTDLTTGSPTGQVNMAQTPAEIGLSSATSDAPTVPANLNARGLDKAQLQEIVKKRQELFDAENASMSGKVAPSSVKSSTGIFAKFRQGQKADLSYVDKAREKASKAVDETKELTMRWAAARSGIHYTSGMEIGDIPAAAIVLATKDIPTPAYVTEAQQYYQTAVSQYGHDITLLREAMAQDAKLQESVNIIAQENNARYSQQMAARDLDLTLPEYTMGEQITQFDAKGMRYTAGSSKEQAEAMQKNMDAKYKFMEKYDKMVGDGQDVSAFSPAISRYWYSAMTSGQIDANAGASHLLGYFSHENTWSAEDKKLAAKLRSRGFNEQSVVTAIVANNVPRLKQNIKELAALNAQAAAAGLGKRSGSTLNTVYNSTDLSQLDAVMRELELQKRSNSSRYLDFRQDDLKLLTAMAASETENPGVLYKDYNLKEAVDDYYMASEPDVKLEALHRAEQQMMASKNPAERLTGSVTFGGFGSSSVQDRKDYLRDDAAIAASKISGQMLGQAVVAMAGSYRTMSGSRDMAMARKEVSDILRKYKNASQSELIKALMTVSSLRKVSEGVIGRAVATAEAIGSRVSADYAERFFDNIDAETMSVANTTPAKFTVTAQSLQIMQERANAMGTEIAKSQIHENADGTAFIMLTPQAAALHQIMDDCTQDLLVKAQSGTALSDGDLAVIVASKNPKGLAALETVAGPNVLTVLRNYYRNVVVPKAAALQQAQMAATANAK